MACGCDSANADLNRVSKAQNEKAMVTIEYGNYMN
jgi:hypothetical protein